MAETPHVHSRLVASPDDNVNELMSWAPEGVKRKLLLAPIERGLHHVSIVANIALCICATWSVASERLLADTS